MNISVPVMTIFLLCGCAIYSAERRQQFAATCPTCKITVYCVPTKIVSNGGRTVEGGIITERTLYLTCPVETRKPTKFTAYNEVFVPEQPKAVEVTKNRTPPQPIPMKVWVKP